MSYRKRGAWKRHPKTTNIRAIEPSDQPGNRKHRRAGRPGGQGFGPLAFVTLRAATPRRRPIDPAPWATGNHTGDVARQFEADHRAARSAA